MYLHAIKNIFVIIIYRVLQARFGTYGGTGRIGVALHAGRESRPDHCLEGLGVDIGGMADPLPLPDGLPRSILQSTSFRALG